MDVDAVKQDPEEEKPQRLLGDDDFEDTGELELPVAPPSAYLMRIPKILYENWRKLEDDEEVQLGVLRRYDNGNEVLSDPLILDPKSSHNRKVPKEYVVRTVSDDLHNTFFFTEKDLPKYRGRSRPHAKAEDRGNHSGVASNAGVEKRRPHYRKAVPKQTALTAIARREATCIAVENAEYDRLMRERQKATDDKTKMNITMLKGDPRQYNQSILPTSLGAKDTSGFGSFFKNAQATGKVKTQENKAARMPRNELLDKLFDCFKKYKYWSTKALKLELRQPEAYLKETLSSIAELVRSGNFNSNYKLRPEVEETNLQFSTKEEQAPEDESMADDDAIAEEVPGPDEESGGDGDEDLQDDDP
ncbi:MAG: hypothetical protein M1828_002588 [Chrysothrix sp. TS-e1954]|nr:MAG: hypothetical protein M1828_002588 [Chrysothrix sp. TS-e1954]